MRISLTIPNNHRVKTLRQPWQDEVGGPQIAEVAALADKLGFSRLTVAEHFLIPADHVELSGAHHLHAVTALAYLAGATSRIRLASNISIVALQHPVVQAKQWAVLDWLSGGRADLIAGAGWLREEFETLGVDFGTRGRRLDEYVEAMRQIWTSDLASYEGEFVRFHEIASEPKPVQPGGVPIWFAGDVPRTLTRVAKWGAGWSPHRTPPEKIAEGVARIHADPGYRGQDVEVFYNLASLRLGEDHRARADDHDFDTWNAQRMIDQLGWIRDLGVTEVTTPLPRLGSYQHFIERLHWLSEEIMPAVGLPVRPAEVDGKLDPGHVPGLVRGEPGDGRGDVLGLADLVGQGTEEERDKLRGLLDQLAHARLQSGVDAVRVDRVHPDAVLGQLVGEALGQPGDAVLGRHVVGDEGQAAQAGDRAGEDDRAAGRLLDHDRDGGPGGVVGAGEVDAAPSAANRTASARPCPRAAPVMNTTWPSNRLARSSAGIRAAGLGAVTASLPSRPPSRRGRPAR